MARMVRMFHASHPSAILVLLGDVFMPSNSFSQTEMPILIIIQVLVLGQPAVTAYRIPLGGLEHNEL